MFMKATKEDRRAPRLRGGPIPDDGQAQKVLRLCGGPTEVTRLSRRRGHGAWPNASPTRRIGWGAQAPGDQKGLDGKKTRTIIGFAEGIPGERSK